MFELLLPQLVGISSENLITMTVHAMRGIQSVINNTLGAPFTHSSMWKRKISVTKIHIESWILKSIYNLGP